MARHWAGLDTSSPALLFADGYYTGEMLEPGVNALADAPSAYLRSAMNEPVQWLQWGAEAFARARAENKPVLLDVGAVWCQWCHVMARESYGDADTAALINEHFIAIKVDRDERLDLDARLQAAVSAISGQSGWPLTVFLTPDATPYFGGTYFPAQERYGQPGFRRVLHMMAHSFQEQRDEVDETAASVIDAVEQSEVYAGPPALLRQPQAVAQVLHGLVGTILQAWDQQFGGFGTQPKFLHPTALSLLLDVAERGGEQADAARRAALGSLHAMARGGIVDQLESGFHRYSLDQRWIVPRFEKMLADNAAMLALYARAARQFDDAACRDTAASLLHWMDSTLCDRERGGFYTAQLADAQPGDNGAYYTWSRAAAAAVLDAEELRFAEAYFDVGPVGDMPHAPAENVLFRSLSLADAARQALVPLERAEQVLQSVTEKLRLARRERHAPPLDRSMYTAWNSMAVSAYVQAAHSLSHPSALQVAQKTVDRILAGVDASGRVQHGMSYHLPGSAPPVPGTLDDHALLAHACLDLWQATGTSRYQDVARLIAGALLREFADRAGGGFFDRSADATDTLGVLAARRVPVQDAPTPSGNAAAAALLLRLDAVAKDDAYKEAALETLERFAGVAGRLGLSAAAYGSALVLLT